MKKGQETLMTTIQRFLEEHDGSLTVRYYNRMWHATVMYDDGYRGQYFEAEHNYIYHAIKFAWKEAEKAQQESITNP